MNLIILTYSLYLGISIGLTIWVAGTLSKNGRVFLVDCFHGNEQLADSVNQLLVVGFYLVNLGFVTRFLKLGVEVVNLQDVFEALSSKIGGVVLVLGVIHFFNLLVLTKLRRRGLATPPPLPAI
jgi:hypothetical protein